VRALGQRLGAERGGVGHAGVERRLQLLDGAGSGGGSGAGAGGSGEGRRNLLLLLLLLLSRISDGEGWADLFVC